MLARCIRCGGALKALIHESVVDVPSPLEGVVGRTEALLRESCSNDASGVAAGVHSIAGIVEAPVAVPHP